MVKTSPSIDFDSEDALHKVIADLRTPYWLRSSSLVENIWSIAHDNDELRRRAEKKVKFDVVLAPGAVRSTHPDFQKDLITAKLLVYLAQRAPEEGGITRSSSFTPMIAREYFTFVRWRASRGIRDNASLTAAWFEEFLDTVRVGGPLSLLPLEARLERYLRRAREDGSGLPFTTSRFHGRPVLSVTQIAHDLGVESAKSIPPRLRDQIVQVAEAQGLFVDRRPPPDVAPRQDGETWTPQRISILLRPISLLHTFRRHLGHDRLRFSPFAGRSPWKSAQALASTAVGRTQTVPAAQACALINSALNWVFSYADPLLESVQSITVEAESGSAASRYALIRRLLDDWTFPPAGDDTPWPFSESGSGGRLRFSQAAFELLPAACMIVIAAFAARRIEEIESLRADAITLDGSDRWLSTWISKTIRDVTRIPVPASVARAVEVLETLSQTRRAITKDQWLFDFADPVGDLHRAFLPARALARFAEHVCVPALPDGSTWHFTPHQFRRFFGVVYYHRYRFPSLAALSQFYRHFDPDMTRTYISEIANGGFISISEEKRVQDRSTEIRNLEKGRLNDFARAGEEFQVERFKEVLSGAVRMSGFGGEALNQKLAAMIVELRPQLEVVSTEEGESLIGEALAAFVTGRRMEPNPLGHSYCKCGPNAEDLAGAKCVQGQPNRQFLSAPDPRFAVDTTCSACPHNVQFPENEAYWRDLARSSDRQAPCAMGTLLQVASEARVKSANAHIARCFE